MSLVRARTATRYVAPGSTAIAWHQRVSLGTTLRIAMLPLPAPAGGVHANSTPSRDHASLRQSAGASPLPSVKLPLRTAAASANDGPHTAAAVTMTVTPMHARAAVRRNRSRGCSPLSCSLRCV